MCSFPHSCASPPVCMAGWLCPAKRVTLTYTLARELWVIAVRRASVLAHGVIQRSCGDGRAGACMRDAARAMVRRLAIPFRYGYRRAWSHGASGVVERGRRLKTGCESRSRHWGGGRRSPCRRSAVCAARLALFAWYCAFADWAQRIVEWPWLARRWGTRGSPQMIHSAMRAPRILRRPPPRADLA